MKVAIITSYDYFNHGNRLQNYALQEVVKACGKEENEVVTLLMTPRKVFPYFSWFTKIFTFVPIISRMNKCQKSTKQTINCRTIDFYSHKKLCALNDQFDAFIVGSDQVWNPKFFVKPEVYFLTFAQKEKCIAYAPSFGVEKLEEKDKPIFENGLSHIKHLSVREETGAKIIKEIVGKDVPITIDPTMLLTKQDWLNFSQQVSKKPEKYILTYFLLAPKMYKRKVKQIAKETGLKVVNLNKSFDKFYKSNPKEFVDLVANAQLVCTNSFHGHVFSILMERPFVSFASPESTSSRISSLLKTFNLEERNFKKLDKKDYFSIDYSFAKQVLEKEREKSLTFLKDALKDVELKEEKK